MTSLHHLFFLCLGFFLCVSYCLLRPLIDPCSDLVGRLSWLIPRIKTAEGAKDDSTKQEQECKSNNQEEPRKEKEKRRPRTKNRLRKKKEKEEQSEQQKERRMILEEEQQGWRRKTKRAQAEQKENCCILIPYLDSFRQLTNQSNNHAFILTSIFMSEVVGWGIRHAIPIHRFGGLRSDHPIFLSSFIHSFIHHFTHPPTQPIHPYILSFTPRYSCLKL